MEINSRFMQGLHEVDARLTQELDGKEKEILAFIIRNKKISSNDCEKFLSISRVTSNLIFKLRSASVKKKEIIKEKMKNKKEMRSEKLKEKRGLSKISVIVIFLLVIISGLIFIVSALTIEEQNVLQNELNSLENEMNNLEEKK